MDIYIIIDPQNVDKFKPKADKIKQQLENNKYIKIKPKLENNMDKNSLCLIFSDNLAYVKSNCSKLKCSAINITSNLQSEYILGILNYVKDIFFLRAETDTIVTRIVNRISIGKEYRKRGMDFEK